jgi:arabinose-5-phosphate isomerase
LVSKNKILRIGIETIDQEIKTLENLKNQISGKFVEAVRILNNTSGKRVFTGIGKSAIIATKVCATFNSIGLTSVFLHGTDALHGDMGIVHDRDVILVFTKSGETAELKEFIQCIAVKDVTIISLTSNPNSSIAIASDIHLEIPVQGETDPFDIIPTSSTIAQLAMGDALAMALMETSGTSLEVLGKLHPQGSIGKKLLLIVAALMQENANPSILENASLKDTIITMTSYRMGATAVINNQSKIIGIITDGDLRRMLESKENLKDIKARDIMTLDPLCITSDMKAYTALKMMEDKAVSQLVVMQENEYLGLIHIHDIIKAGIK